MASYAIAQMRAIGPFYAAKLKAVGIRSSAKLLDRASSPRMRKQLADATGIPQGYILNWANMADLMRVPGIAADYSELLTLAGVDTVKALKRRNAANLVSRMATLNAEKRLVELLPSEKRVLNWIEAAQSLEAVMTY